jgi:hypothetical protein
VISHAELDASRRRGDPAADRLLVELGQNFWTVLPLLDSLPRLDDPLPAALPAQARRFLEAESELSKRFDRTRTLEAQRWASRHLFHVTTALFHAALPSSYAAAKGAAVLHATGRMREDLDRRVNETARFVLCVLEEGAFEPRGRGVRAVLRVRLVHAMTRALLVARQPAPEVPLNQEDLLGALFTFSVVTIEAVRRLGVAVSAREADDYYALFRGIGLLLGIEAALLPPDFESALLLSACIADRQFRPSAAGRDLMSVLAARIEAHVRVPELPHYLVRRLAGDRVADIVGVPEVGRVQSLLARVGRVGWLGGSALNELALGLAPVVGQRLLRGVVQAKLEHPVRGER